MIWYVVHRCSKAFKIIFKRPVRNRFCDFDNFQLKCTDGTFQLLKFKENKHVKFFYDKLLYLHLRYFDLYAECIKRGFKVTSYHASFLNLPPQLYNNYKPTKMDREMILERIAERIEQSKVM